MSINTKLNIKICVSLLVLILLIGGFGYAFFNYTKIGQASSLRLGNINFQTTEQGIINLENIFPIDSNDLSNTEHVDSIDILINGSTTYFDGIEYLVSIDGEISNLNVNNKTIPVSLNVDTIQENNKTIGTSDDDYFTNRGKNTTIYKKLSQENLSSNDSILVGYIAPNSPIDGKITLTAFFDKDKIAISDTYYNNGLTTDEWVNGRVVLTTTEWNELGTTKPISFKIKVEANEGIWVQNNDLLIDFSKNTYWNSRRLLSNTSDSSRLSNKTLLDVQPGDTL